MPSLRISGILALFPHEISFYTSLRPIALFPLHRQWACGRQRQFIQLFAQTREMAQIYGSRILITPPTSAYTQHKYVCVGSPFVHVWAATLADLRERLRSNTKLSAGLKRSYLREGHVPPVPGAPLALDQW